MRVLLWISIILAGLYSGYWFVGKAAYENKVAGFFADAPSRGLDISHEGYAIAGFPSRFDLTVTEPRLADPRSGLRWQAPFVQILALSYKPWHVIAAFANSQTFQTPGGQITLESAKLQASIIVTPNTSLALDRSALVGTELIATLDSGQRLLAGELRLASRLDPTRSDNTHAIGLEIADLSIDPPLSPDMPRVIDLVRLDASINLSAPVDRYIAEKRPQIASIGVNEALLTWGPLKAFAKGNLVVFAGQPEGRIDIRIEGWKDLLELAIAAGLVSPKTGQTIARGITAYIGATDTPDILDVPLTLENGEMRLGPIPLGPVPRLN